MYSNIDTMNVRLLVGHRKDSYPGEYAPEVVAVVDEFTIDDNPEWWSNEVAKQKALWGTDADAWAEIEVSLPREELMAALYPTNTVTPVSVKAV